MSIKGVARFYKGRKKHIITTQTEHKCVLDSCRAMEREGYEVRARISNFNTKTPEEDRIAQAVSERNMLLLASRTSLAR